jgi:D-alanine transaminase
MKELIYLNGEFISKENALISPDDRGFIFGDGVYEVIKYYNGKPLRYPEHMERFGRSLKEIQIDLGSLNEYEAVFKRLLEENGLKNEQAAVYIQATRGVHKRMHQFPNGIKPSVYAFASAMPSPTEKLEKGVKVITHEDIRWLRCDIKSVSLLANTMLFTKAIEAGAWECILIRNGVITEATHSSVLAVKDKKVITHPLSNLILSGITRKIVLEICAENKIAFEERAFTEKELYEMDELLIAGTGSEITPVVQINDIPLGNKKPGEITRLIQHEFFKLT